jgi:hypothetical protein
MLPGGLFVVGVYMWANADELKKNAGTTTHSFLISFFDHVLLQDPRTSVWRVCSRLFDHNSNKTASLHLLLQRLTDCSYTLTAKQRSE